jgi:regulator of replication initiation timing
LKIGTGEQKMGTLNAEQVIKALECCDGTLDGCEDCPYNKDGIGCKYRLPTDALALIKEQQADNEKLTINMNAYGLTAKNLAEEIDSLTEQLRQAVEAVEWEKNKANRLQKENERLKLEKEGAEAGAMMFVKELQAHNENLKKENKYLRERLAEEMEHKKDMEGDPS